MFTIASGKKTIMFQIGCIYLARYLALFAIFSLLLFPNILKVILPIVVLLTVLTGNWQKKYMLLKNNFLVIGSTVLVILFAVGMIYSKASMADIITGFFKYTKVLYIFFLLPLFAQPQWRRYAANVLIITIFIDVLVYFLRLHGIIEINPVFYPAGYLRYPISIAAIMGFVAFILVNRFIDEKKYRWLYLTLFLFAVYSLFFIFTKRTGQLIFFVLLALCFCQRFGARGVLAALIIIPLTSGFLFWASPHFYENVKKGVNEAINYIKTENAANTSIGDRLAFTQYSLKVIREHPFFGTGTGSFTLTYSKTGGPALAPGALLRDPHNEFVMIAFQIGIIGLSWFLIWLGAQWYETKKLPRKERFLAQGVITSFITICFCNTALVVVVSGLFYVFFISVYSAARYDTLLS